MQKKRYVAFILYAMKISIVQGALVLIFSLSCYANGINAQDMLDKEVSLSVENLEIRKILAEIKDQTGVRFIYSSKLIQANRKISFKVVNKKLRQLLDEYFKPLNIEYRVVNKQLLLYATKHEVSVQGLNPADLVNHKLPMADKRTITGIIKNDRNEPLVGVTVNLKNSNVYTTTDENGRFSIEVPETDAVLVLSYTGYVSREVEIGKGNEVVFSLSSVDESLNDVVVVGYGTKKKRDLIGSVTRLEGKNIMNPAYSSVNEALQGMAAGVMVSDGQIRIRGINSVNLDAGPLWIVDGFLTGGNDINFNDIESIDIQKDAAATSIYGSRAAGGVIMVTTKSGKLGRGSVNVNVNSGISRFANNGYTYADTKSYLATMDLAQKNYQTAMGQPITLFSPISAYIWNGAMKTEITREEAEAANTNKNDAITQRGKFSDVNISTSRGTEQLKLYLSLNYRKDEAMTIGNANNKISGRINITYSPFKNFNISLINTTSYAKNRIGINYNPIWLPFMPLYDANDPTGYWNPALNPLAKADINYRDIFNTSLGSTTNLGLEFIVPGVTGLRLKATGGYTGGASNYTSWESEYMRAFNNSPTPKASEGAHTALSTLFNTNIYYDRSFKLHTVGALVGVETGRTVFSRGVSLEARDLNGTFHEVGTPPLEGIINSRGGFNGENYALAYYSRISYKYNDKYIVEGSLRRDGSSSFDEDHRWGTFASIGAGWILSEESFLRDIQSMNLLKLRGSYGQTGNSTLSINNVFSNNYALTSGPSYLGQQSTFLTNIGNRAATWETSTGLDVGLDFGFLNSRINGSVAYYSKDINGLLLQVPLPPSSGIPGGNLIWQNIGNMRNSGLEFTVHASPVNMSNFSWEIGFNHSTNKNEVLKLHPQVDERGTGLIPSEYPTITKKGLTIGTYYMPEFAGIDPEKGIPMTYEIDQAVFSKTGETVKTGRLIPLSNYNGDQNRIIMEGKSGIPKWYGGLTNTLRYSHFDLFFNFTYAGGFYAYDDESRSISYINNGWENIAVDRFDRSWKKPGDIAKYPQLMTNNSMFYDNEGNFTPGQTTNMYNRADSRYLVKGDYVKLKTVVFGYNLPGKLFRNIGTNSGVKIYVQLTNVWTSSKNSNGDPEMVYTQNINGLVTNTMPTIRTYALGISCKF